MEQSNKNKQVDHLAINSTQTLLISNINQYNIISASLNTTQSRYRSIIHYPSLPMSLHVQVPFSIFDHKPLNPSCIACVRRISKKDVSNWFLWSRQSLLPVAVVGSLVNNAKVIE